MALRPFEGNLLNINFGCSQQCHCKHTNIEVPRCHCKDFQRVVNLLVIFTRQDIWCGKKLVNADNLNVPASPELSFHRLGPDQGWGFRHRRRNQTGFHPCWKICFLDQEINLRVFDQPLSHSPFEFLLSLAKQFFNQVKTLANHLTQREGCHAHGC